MFSPDWAHFSMNTRQLGSHGPELTEIGFGAWAVGGSWKFGWGAVNDNESVAAIHRALDLGINWIDTAAAYGLGHSEEVVGRALRGRRDNVFLATKCCQVWDERGNVGIVGTASSVRKEMEDSLRRLQTDHVDLYQIHWPDWSTPIEETWGELARLQKEGKARYIGVSNFGVDLLDRCEPIAHVQSLQPIYNLLERGVEGEILTWCRTHGTGIVAYSPMQSGLLSGTFDRTKLAADDWRIVHSEKFREPKYSRGLALVEFLKPMAARYGKSVGQLAVAWVLMNPAVTSAIVGARKAGQVEANVGGSGWKISDKDMKEIAAYLESQKV
jgi:aryl-alcohol dehydrogenase-like predicted oxidoreductase